MSSDLTVNITGSNNDSNLIFSSASSQIHDANSSAVASTETKKQNMLTALSELGLNGFNQDLANTGALKRLNYQYLDFAKTAIYSDLVNGPMAAYAPMIKPFDKKFQPAYHYNCPGQYIPNVWLCEAADVSVLPADFSFGGVTYPSNLFNVPNIAKNQHVQTLLATMSEVYLAEVLLGMDQSVAVPSAEAMAFASTAFNDISITNLYDISDNINFDVSRAEANFVKQYTIDRWFNTINSAFASLKSQNIMYESIFNSLRPMFYALLFSHVANVCILQNVDKIKQARANGQVFEVPAVATLASDVVVPNTSESSPNKVRITSAAGEAYKATLNYNLLAQGLGAALGTDNSKAYPSCSCF